MRYIVTIASALVLPVAAQAQTFNAQQGFYVGASGGLQWAIDPAGPTWTGWAVNGKAGYDFVGPRAELEVGYGQIPNAAFAPGTAISGKVGALSVMANAYYDFLPTSVITPYVGAGRVGVAFVDGNSALGSTQFAYQGILGVAYNATEQLRFTLEGRWFGTTNPGWYGPAGYRSFTYDNAMVLAGVSFKFGAPAAAAPPPPPVAAAAPPSFMVFFDWDRATLSPQALATIGQAAGAFRANGSARITATGHTDTSGPESYNMALSLRRANTVKDALVRDGVPAQAIVVIGKGEQGLLVPTADGVREPQNRRVEIVLQ